MAQKANDSDMKWQNTELSWEEVLKETEKYAPMNKNAMTIITTKTFAPILLLISKIPFPKKHKLFFSIAHFSGFSRVFSGII